MDEENKDWQISYIVDDLIAPEAAIVSDDILIRRGRNKRQAYVFFKITDEESENIGFPKKDKLDELFYIYALEMLRHSKLSYWRTFVKTPINEMAPFGQRVIPGIPIVHPDEQLSEKLFTAMYHGLQLATDELKRLGDILSDRERAYVRNALEYFYKSLGEDDLKKRLIDLVISLESLFSPGIEIRYRVSLRMATLLGYIGKDKKRVFDIVYDFYNKRSRMVHGDVNVDIEWAEFYEFESYLRDCCRIYLYLDKKRKDVLQMLDESLILKSTQDDLGEIIKSAYEEWKKSGFYEFENPLPRQTKAQASIQFIPK